MTTVFKPNDDRVLIKPIKGEEKKIGQIIIPVGDNNKMSFLGEVIAMSDYFDRPDIHKPSFGVGDKVEVREMMYDEVTLDEVTYKAVQSQYIIGTYFESADQQ